MDKHCCSANISMEQAEGLTTNFLNLIYHRYDLHIGKYSQLFKVSGNIQESAWDILKYKFALAIINQGEFRMIFGGSSVTAAWDNSLNQSYPSVIEAHLRPALEALGVKLIVRNIAQGNNPCFPSNYCYQSMGGERADFIGWEQSFDCGRDPGMHEVVARIAGRMGAVVYYSASGGISTKECPPSNETVPRISHLWTPQLLSPTPPKYAPTLQQVRALRAELNKWNKDGPSVGKFASPLQHTSYRVREKREELQSISQSLSLTMSPSPPSPPPGVGAHGFNFWAKSNSLCDASTMQPQPVTQKGAADDKGRAGGRRGCVGADVRGPCQSEGGPNWVTKEASFFNYDGGRESRSTGVHWHPSTGIHRLRGEALVWVYGHILLDAIHMISHDLEQSSTNDPRSLGGRYERDLADLQPPLPPPQMCGRMCQSPPRCLTDYTPHFNRNGSLESALVGGTGWKRMVEHHEGPQGQQLDTRPFYQTSESDQRLNIQISVVEQRFAFVCAHLNFVGHAPKAGVKTTVSHIVFELFVNTSLAVPEQGGMVWSDKKEVDNDCVELMNLPLGQHILSMRLGAKGKSVSVAHVITF